MLLLKEGLLPPFEIPRFFAGLPPLQPACIGMFRNGGTERLCRSTCRALREKVVFWLIILISLFAKCRFWRDLRTGQWGNLIKYNI
jgi:hypothetical protein